MFKREHTFSFIIVKQLATALKWPHFPRLLISPVSSKIKAQNINNYSYENNYSYFLLDSLKLWTKLHKIQPIFLITHQSSFW